MSRTFTDGEEPPFGERLVLMDVSGNYIIWSGKRWAWEVEAHDPALYDAWPPPWGGPWFEVPK